jgi:hypothetical protein
MRKPAALFASVFVLTAVFAGAASADPTNSNAGIESFACSNGVTFDGTATVESRTATGHVLTASDPSLDGAVFQAKYVTIDGTVVKKAPGFDGRSLVDCVVTAVGGQPIEDLVVFTGFFTPASG